MRTLATIQRISEIADIPNADAIQRATILGWHCVIKKGDFDVGDLVVFCEIDSLLPVIPQLEFLAKNGTKKSYVDGREYEGYRLRTVRLRGQISQGLCLPISILNGKKYPSDTRDIPPTKLGYDIKEGDEVSDLLGVVKYEPQLSASLAGVAKGMFPAFIPKTDEERIQTCPEVLTKYKDSKFYITEKVDGASCTIYIEDGVLNVCSRNLNLLESAGNTFWKVARETDLENKLKKLGRRIALQGELIGGNVNGNKLNASKHTILFFNVYDIEKGRYLDYLDFRVMCKFLEIPTVPVISENFILMNTVDEMVEFAKRKSTIAPDVWAEGIVVRPLTEMRDEDLGRLSFKIINPEFLLKYSE